MSPRETALKIEVRKTIVRDKMDFLEGWFLSEGARSFSGSCQRWTPHSSRLPSHSIQTSRIAFHTVLNNTENTV
jgi:hypothetical protein